VICQPAHLARGLAAAALACSLSVAAQTPQQTAQAPATGVSGGLGAAAVYDSEHRPITAGGFVDSGPIVFQDITKAAGLSGWVHKMGVPQKNFIVETNGSGVALLDYDNDGWLDIYLVNGATFDSLDGKETSPHAALFHNNHDGTFTDVAAKAGVTNDRWGYGVSIADFDNDGWPDIYVGNYGKNRLYRNNHDGTFTDVAEKAGVALGNWSPGSTWGDYDGDGNLDLYVTGYVHFDRDNPPLSGSKAVNYAQCLYRGVQINCGPRGLQGEPDHLFHNNGDGTFTDVTQKAGVEDKDKAYGFTSIFISLNASGRPDLVVGNDSTPNFLYVNKGNGTFDDQSYPSGFALNDAGREIASMGIAAGDYENNGEVDFFVSDFGDDYKVLYRSDGTGAPAGKAPAGAVPNASFTDVSYRTGVAQPTIPFVGWGTGFLDYDNDGWQDLFMVSGHVYPQVDRHEWGTSWAERPLLFHNIPGKEVSGSKTPTPRRFDLVPAVKGTGLSVVIPARGAAFGDLFNDGKIDVVINPVDGSPVLLRNVNPDHHHWVAMNLVGGTDPRTGKKSPRDATCATVFLTANGMRQRQDVLSSGSYISANDRRPHFGLGDATDPGTAEIHWPNGHIETVKLPAVDRIYTIEENKGITSALCASKPCSAQ
jgi:enediyne biosynthesis protein E4